jgi:hypothetical protein
MSDSAGVQGRGAESYEDFFQTTDPVWWKLGNEADDAPTWLIRHPGPCHGGETRGHGALSKAHHVEEHDDGMISVMPQEGNSNSILCSCGWHGFIDHGVWVKA